MTDMCVCSHPLDHHNDDLECEVDDCMCFYFEQVEDEEEEE